MFICYLTAIGLACLLGQRLRQQRQFTQRYVDKSSDERVWYNNDDVYVNVWQKHREEIP